jgi:hypothetical protein
MEALDSICQSGILGALEQLLVNTAANTAMDAIATL